MTKTLVLIEGYDEQKPVVKYLNAKPVDGEHSAFEATLKNGAAVIVVTTGVGPDQAHRVSADCINQFKPTLVISAGTCGALTSEMEIGDWLVTGTVQSLGKPDGQGREPGETLTSSAHETIEELAQALGEKPRRHEGRLVSVADDPVHEAGEKAAIAGRHGAIAVDMESFGVARAATEKGIPWLIARVVVDTPAIPLPPLGAINVQTGRPPLSGIAMYVLKHPIAGPKVLYGLWDLVQVYARDLVRVLPALGAGAPA
jgi:nucleoside phosphorylase